MRSDFDEPVDPYRGRPGDPFGGDERTTEVTPLGVSMDRFLPWDYHPDAGWAPEFDLTGYHVEAADGPIGKVRQSAYATGGSYLVVDTGPWIFGRTVVIPAGVVTNFDHAGRRIYLDRTKEVVRSSPDYSDEPAYWDKIAAHFGPR